MPIVARWWSTGPLGSTTSTSPASLPQDLKEGSASNPATIRRWSTRTPVLRDWLCSSEQSEEWKLTTLRRTWKLVARSARNVGGFHRQSCGRRSVSIKGHTRKHASKNSGVGKHSIFNHFPKDRNCEICKRTKITSALCRNCNGESVLQAQNFGDLKTADHKVPSEGCESRNNHRYAVVVQDLATQWL